LSSSLSLLKTTARKAKDSVACSLQVRSDNHDNRTSFLFTGYYGINLIGFHHNHISLYEIGMPEKPSKRYTPADLSDVISTTVRRLPCKRCVKSEEQSDLYFVGTTRSICLRDSYGRRRNQL
jgi:hypothetical protein